MDTDTTSKTAAASDAERERFRGRHGFSNLMRAWHLEVAGPGDDATFQERQEADRSWEDLHLAQQALAYQVPHLCCLRDKLDIIIHYASTAGTDLDTHERLVLNGIMALRADIVNFGG